MPTSLSTITITLVASITIVVSVFVILIIITACVAACLCYKKKVQSVNLHDEVVDVEFNIAYGCVNDAEISSALYETMDANIIDKNF